MALGETKAAIALMVERELLRAGDGAVDEVLAKRIALAVAVAIEENNYRIEMEIRQKLQVSGLHV